MAVATARPTVPEPAEFARAARMARPAALVLDGIVFGLVALVPS